MSYFRTIVRPAGLAVVAMLVLAACGAGTTQAPPPTPTPPPPPPQQPAFSVVATTPADGATEVSIFPTITIRFSAPADNDAGSGGNPCTPGNITIAPAPVFAFGCTVLGDTVTLAGGTLAGTTTYTVTVAAQVANVGRTARLGSNFVFRFTTRTGQLTTAALAPVGQWGYAANLGATGAVVGAALAVGDCEVGGGGSPPPCPVLANLPARVRAFAAFGLPGALVGPPPAAVQSATLFASLSSVVNATYFDIFAGGGPIRVQRVDYLNNGALDQGDYSMGPASAAVLVFDQTSVIGAPVQVDITNMVSNAIGAPPTTIPGATPYLGLRFHWGTSAGFVENTDGQADDDMATLTGIAVSVSFWR